MASMSGLSDLGLPASSRTGIAEPSSSTGAANLEASGSLPPTSTEQEEEQNTRRKKGKKRDAKESVLSDSSFIEGKNKKLKLEIDALQMKTEVQEEREALELDLLRAKIAEVNSRREFFQTVTSIIKKKNTISFMESLFNENED